jgi:hypothetical protein
MVKVLNTLIASVAPVSAITGVNTAPEPPKLWVIVNVAASK